MQIRTIFLYMSRRQGCEPLLAAACALARRYEAHLIGAAAFSAVPPVPAMPITYDASVIEEMLRAAQAAEADLQDVFNETTRGQSFVAEWISVRAHTSDLVGSVLQHARAADIIITAQRDPDWDLGPVLDFPERLALESGRPVVLIPRAGHSRNDITKIAIAWNGTRESARAAFDAFPFYPAAENVTILTVSDDGKPPSEGTPASALAATLARHDIRTSLTHLSTSRAGVSQTLVEEAVRLEADLLVMGAYGHSRLREFVFGGVTRNLTSTSPVPLLLSH